ncbi:Hypothetical Protein FCC1311_000662 [Hondaea fermentalgiana]|uniref:Uncharacterized protein n=1 Tax=Hondaea fermentalgiana TaxID=2315210 RepID=A0A2R5FYL1_9STRA|nr:Hypothetical Protein FCC1311_000662 [Hondaea fermentalgiana]|eukprot:GBG23846.1 Hypothetical Protein FCC1311_000662 [Hondaea fermentalgiana]
MYDLERLKGIEAQDKSYNSQGNVFRFSEEASSSREPNPPQNADEVPAGTSESVPDTMEEEDLVKAALFANAALSGYTGGKLNVAIW